MKKFSLLALTLVLCVAFTASAALAKPVRMTMTSLYMDKHPVIQKVYLPWMEEIKKRTNGEIQISYYNPNTVCPEAEMYDAAKKGQVSISLHVVTRVSGKFPLNAISNFPSPNKTAKGAARTYWELYQATPEIQAEYEGVKVLSLFTTAPVNLSMISTTIKTVDDIKGKKILTGGIDSTRSMRLLGANPIAVPPTDYYLSLQRGMAEGCFVPVAPMRSFKINEATKYTTLCNMMMAGGWVVMNQATYDALTPEQKKVFDELSGTYLMEKHSAILDESDTADIALLSSQKHEFYIMPDAERDKLIAIILPGFEEAWFKLVTDRGMPKARAEEIYASYKKIAGEQAAIFNVK